MKTKYFTLLLFCSLFIGCSDGTSTSSINNQDRQARGTIGNKDDNSRVLTSADGFDIDGVAGSRKQDYAPRRDVTHAYYYKPNDISIVWCENGLLNLRLMKDEMDPRGYKSGSICTDEGKFDFTCDKVEVRAKFPSGDGL